MSRSDDLLTEDLWDDFISHTDVDLFHDPDPDPAEHLYSDKERLRPFDVVLPNLIVGGDDYTDNAEVLAHLLDLGVTHALDCRTEFEHKMDEGRHGFTRPHRALDLAFNHTDDDGVHKPVGYFFTAMSWATKALTTNPSAVLYVHCAMGINRGPSNALAVMQGVMGMTDVQAMTALRVARPQAGAVYWKDVNRDVRLLEAVSAARKLSEQIEVLQIRKDSK